MNEHIGKPFDMVKLVSLLIRMTGFQTPAVQLKENTTSIQHVFAVPTVVGLDLRTALGRMSGMRSLYVRTARDFVKIIDAIIPELRQCLTSGDKPKALMRLHTLKGNAGTLGATELAANAAKLETLCVTGAGMQECEQGLEGFAILVQSTQEALKEAIAQLEHGPVATSTGGGAAPTPLAGEAAMNALRRISALSAASDLEALQCFAQARELLSGLPVGFMDGLDEALQNLDLEAAHLLCEDMLSRLPT
jgi:HPt (histidine-containing phosphotransfer) domain-containing protein